jgi:hypothetical protein
MLSVLTVVTLVNARTTVSLYSSALATVLFWYQNLTVRIEQGYSNINVLSSNISPNNFSNVVSRGPPLRRGP